MMNNCEPSKRCTVKEAPFKLTGKDFLVLKNIIIQLGLKENDIIEIFFEQKKIKANGNIYKYSIEDDGIIITEAEISKPLDGKVIAKVSGAITFPTEKVKKVSHLKSKRGKVSSRTKKKFQLMNMSAILLSTAIGIGTLLNFSHQYKPINLTPKTQTIETLDLELEKEIETNNIINETIAESIIEETISEINNEESFYEEVTKDVPVYIADEANMKKRMKTDTLWSETDKINMTRYGIPFAAASAQLCQERPESYDNDKNQGQIRKSVCGQLYTVKIVEPTTEDIKKNRTEEHYWIYPRILEKYSLEKLKTMTKEDISKFSDNNQYFINQIKSALLEKEQNPNYHLETYKIEDFDNPKKSREIMLIYLTSMIQKFESPIRGTVAYNMGPSVVKKYSLQELINGNIPEDGDPNYFRNVVQYLTAEEAAQDGLVYNVNGKLICIKFNTYSYRVSDYENEKENGPRL